MAVALDRHRQASEYDGSDDPVFPSHSPADPTIGSAA